MVTQILANTTDGGLPSPSSRELVYQHTLVLTNPIQPLWRFRDSQRIGEICNQREQTTDVQTKATKGFIPVRSKEHGIAFSSPWLHCIDSHHLRYWEHFSWGWFTLQPHKFPWGAHRARCWVTLLKQTTITKKRSLNWTVETGAVFVWAKTQQLVQWMAFPQTEILSNLSS